MRKRKYGNIKGSHYRYEENKYNEFRISAKREIIRSTCITQIFTQKHFIVKSILIKNDVFFIVQYSICNLISGGAGDGGDGCGRGDGDSTASHIKCIRNKSVCFTVSDKNNSIIRDLFLYNDSIKKLKEDKKALIFVVRGKKNIYCICRKLYDNYIIYQNLYRWILKNL